MGWYQCECGFLTEKAAELGDTITSVYHLHKGTRLDGSASIVRMEAIPTPLPAGEAAVGPAQAEVAGRGEAVAVGGMIAAPGPAAP